ncbi:MAG: flagellin [Pseudobacteriovorax sp.]|nr:flagellin [Pseudobacteriovorax sp.]
MSGINPNAKKLSNRLMRATRERSNSLEKLSSGKVFTSREPRPSDRALAAGLEFKLKSAAAAKRNINDAISLIQTADSGFNEISNILVRMKEIGTAAATTTVSDKERKYLFIEYEALHKELDRIASTTEFNSIPLMNGENEKTPESLILRVGDPSYSELANNDSGDINEIVFDNLKDIVATTAGLGIKTASDLITEDYIEIDDAMELIEPEDDEYATVFDQALDRLTNHRASFGAIQARIQRALDVNEVMEENISAAKSKIEDTDYAEEIAKMTQSTILMQANTALVAQTGIGAELGLALINAAI